MCKKPFVKRPIGIGRKKIALSEDARLASTPFPCGQCLHCRINRSRIWQHRLLLEQLTSQCSSFITLTYNDENVPENGSLVPEDVSKFLKRLRYYLPQRKVRYYMVGEYGDGKERPHYHGALYNVGLFDEQFVKQAWSIDGKEIGFIMLGDLNHHSARYLVGYVTKGMTRKDNPMLKGRLPEFARMSKGNPGGLGAEAAKMIGQKLETEEKNLAVVRELRHGKKMMPLGKYLQDLVAKAMKCDDNKKGCEFWDYQQEMFENHMTDGEIFIDNVQEESRVKRRRQEKKTQIYKQKRSL